MLPVRHLCGLSVLFLALSVLISSCSSNSGIPSTLRNQVDQTVTFSQMKESPDTYRGRILMLGGEVLSAKRLKEGTRLEILQLPIDGQEPIWDRTQSQGRFVAVQKEFLDPATVPHGTRITIVGEVSGVITLPLDETEYAYPVLEIRNLMVWPDRIARSPAPPPPYMVPYYWGPYGGPWGPFWWRGWYGPYWW